MNDLNYLFMRQQQERTRADAAANAAARDAHLQLARCYELLIGELTAGRVTIAPVPAFRRAMR